VCYTDFWEAYTQVLPNKRHRVVGKDSGKTNHIERFNNTLRQWVGRLIRKTLSFSKKVANHVGAIWNFIHHYNASLSFSSITAASLPRQQTGRWHRRQNKFGKGWEQAKVTTGLLVTSTGFGSIAVSKPQPYSEQD
jgi:hypothetical protein